ncbi:hypothetical protein [Halalkalibacillus sediminis]|uniref:hypothetical protein n=1 Tax=Halalkalibacillus sediminis TaxID=2018042 RepID=UPI0013906891|nr:hypothetical protein [Halalkalibacillus sediminis]
MSSNNGFDGKKLVWVIIFSVIAVTIITYGMYYYMQQNEMIDEDLKESETVNVYS